MSRHIASNQIEILESRITPAPLTGFISITAGGSVQLEAGTDHAGIIAGGAYLLHVASGKAIVFSTDLNLNGITDFNEITGIAAGDGLEITLFTDLHGDVATNLRSNFTLTDSDGNPGNDSPTLGGDGRVLLDTQIKSITLRSLTVADLTDVTQDGVVNDDDVNLRLARSTYSIYGNVYAGGGLGKADGTGGIIIDVAGNTAQGAKFSGVTGGDLFADSNPQIGSVLIGSAASGELLNFGVSAGLDTLGLFTQFVPSNGKKGGEINGIIARNGIADLTGEATVFSVGRLQAGNGGFGGAGGDISNVRLNGDIGGYDVIAGNGGRGLVGGKGGSIIEFTDLGSITSQVRIISGDGGQGLTGTGGDGGKTTFGTVNLFGGVSVELGSGGDGFTKGGDGAGLATATFESPKGDIPVGLNIAGTMHNPYAIDSPTSSASETLGKFSAIDFNGDGFGDSVFTTTGPDQVVVVFGDGNGGFFTSLDPNPALRPIFLNAPAGPSALTVGDFDGDSRPDIAVASNDEGASGTISIFFSRSVDSDGDGALDQFVGFSQPRISTLPLLNSFNGNPGGAIFRGAIPIVGLAAGDFNGDGVTDLAVDALYTFTDPARTVDHFIMFLTGDNQIIGTADYGTGAVSVTSGLLYADFGAIGAVQTPFIDFGKADADNVLRAAHLQTSDNFDVLFIARVGEESISILDTHVTPTPFQTFIFLGQVDTNRKVGDTDGTDAKVLDFTTFDLDGDDLTDIAVLLTDPKNFIVTETGDGTGLFTPASGLGDNAGISLVGNNSSAHLPSSVDLQRIVGADTDGDGTFDEVALYSLGNGNAFAQAIELTLAANTATADSFLFLQPLLSNDDKTNTVVVFDSYRPLSGDNTVFAYGNLDPTTDPAPFYNFAGDTFSFNLFPLPFSGLTTNVGFSITAGNGGNSIVGSGGKGGSLGGELTVANGIISAAITYLFAPATSVEELGILVSMVSGNGGNGFKAGGAGGDLSGIYIDYAQGTSVQNSAAFLTAGNGGNGIAGDGGKGGTLSNNIIVSGTIFQAGNGGSGRKGGHGGNVIGNGFDDFTDSENETVFAIAGNAGDGIKAGGRGGSINNFVVELTAIIGGEAGALGYVAGNGGNAISGNGGRGGDILNSSPRIGTNLTDPLFLIAGDGGRGLTGGRGGNVTNFQNIPATQSAIPSLVSVIAGDGGVGLTGSGGRGGSITDVKADGKAFFVLNSTTLINTAIAGNGGDSFGGRGGDGGELVRVDITATGGAAFGASGAGGDGLSRGGDGGDVRNSLINASQSGGQKVVIIAGKGGDASSFKPAVSNPQQNGNAFGGKAGVGGDGGSIVNFSQVGSIETRVDLIAGNGGSTINYGTSQSASKVGKGGSIINAQIAGDIGNIDPTVPIKAYNDTVGDFHTDISMAAFVTMVEEGTLSILRQDDPITGISTLTDAIGNVGLIAGAAGRVKNDQPAANGVNGSATNISARNIMSMVAGGIDRVAAIQSASNINITVTNGDAGSDKDLTGFFDFRMPDGTVVSTPVPTAVPLGGSLIDGYIVTRNPIPGLPPGGRVVVPS